MAELAGWLAEAIERRRVEQAAYIEMAGPIWVVHLDEAADYVYGPEPQFTSLVASVMNMHRRVNVAQTTEQGIYRAQPCTPWSFARKTPCPIEHIAAPECSMRDVMACVRRSGLHGFYYKAPEVRKEYITGALAYERKEYRF